MHTNDSAHDATRQWSEVTQLATEIMDDSARVVSEGRDLGKQVSAHVRELFVVCDPAEALRQHFEVGVTPFMALHDLGTGHSRDYLGTLSRASGWPLRRLHIRRQGFGTVLATLHYIECPGQHQTPLRLYASDAEAESSVRIAIRRQLLNSATANALLAEDLPEQVATLAYACLRDDLLSQSRTGVSMLVLPQSRAPRLSQGIEALQRAGGPRIETAPATSAVNPSWALLATYWNREAARLGTAGLPLLARINLDPTPMPVVRGAAAAAPSTASNTASNTATPSIATSATASVTTAATAAAPATATAATTATLSAADYLRLVAGRAGASSGCIFDAATRAVEAHVGDKPAAELAQQGQALLLSIARVGDGLGLGRAVSEATVALGDVLVVVRPTPLRPGCAMLLLLARSAEAAYWRREIEQIDAALR